MLEFVLVKLLGFRWIVSNENDPGFKLLNCQFYYYKWNDTILIVGFWNRKTGMSYRLAEKREIHAVSKRL